MKACEEIAAKDARIAALEETVAKAFLRCQALEEALDGFLCHFTGIPAYGGERCSYHSLTVSGGVVLAARKARDLCHAAPVPGCDTSSAEGPPQSGDGESTQT